MSKRSRRAGLEALGVPAAPGSIYEVALTHRSFAFENLNNGEHNERLEFLGDAVLGAIVTDLIFRNYPDLAEGEMARLRASVVSTTALADVARSLGLGEQIRLGKGEEADGGRDKDSLLADTFEALIGAVHVDRGTDVVRDFLEPLFSERVRDVVAAGGGREPKTTLQEVVARSRGTLPSYRVASSGPDHDKRFTAHVYVGEELHGVGTGRSKKEAEQSAAAQALHHLGRDQLVTTESDAAAVDSHSGGSHAGTP